MAVHEEDFSTQEPGPARGWRVGDVGGDPGSETLEVAEGEGGRILHVRGHEGDRPPLHLVWSGVGPVEGDFDLLVRFRWIRRATTYSCLLEARPPGARAVPRTEALAGGFEAVLPRLGWKRKVRRRLAALKRGRLRPRPLPPPTPVVRVRRDGGTAAERPFGTPGAGFGAHEPRLGEWMWARLSHSDGKIGLRFWRDGFLEPDDPWVQAEGGPGERELGLCLSGPDQELEIGCAALGTGGDRAPAPVPAGVRAEPAPWYDPAWARRKRIVVPRAHFAEPLADFPLFVDLSGDEEIRDAAQPDGSDILFTGADGVTPLAHECATHRRLLREQAVWTVWSDPRGLRHVGERDRTYVTYYTTNRGWWISAFDHRSDAWEHVQLRTHEASASGRWWDDHNNPAVTVRPDGRLVVAYNEHSTERAWVRISESPEDISRWGAEIPVRAEHEAGDPDPRYSYADLYALPDGTLWRHYRPRDGYGISRPSTFVTSRDGGESWSAPTRFFEVPTRTPYVVTTQRGDRIDFFCNEAHPNEYHRTSIYHFYYDHATGLYHRSDGIVIGDARALPVGTDEATLVYDGTTIAGEGWVHSIESDGRGGLAALYVAYAGEKHGLPDSALVHEYWYARWNGEAWERHFLARDRGRLDSHANQRYYAGGGVIDPEDLDVVYLSLVDPSHEGGGHPPREGEDRPSHSRHVFRYETSDGGGSWSRRRLTRGDGRGASRPFVPRNRHEELPVFWLHGDYVNYYEYHTSLAAGNDRGPVLESEHYVRVPRIDPAEDLVLYVYYGNARRDRQAPGAVWPESLRFRYRGSLGMQNLGPVDLGGGEALTLEVNASLATRRQVELEHSQHLLSNRPLGRGAGILLRRPGGALHLEAAVATRDGELVVPFRDLELEVRDHVSAVDPPRMSFASLRLAVRQEAGFWLNGVRSEIREALSDPLAVSPSLELWTNATPHDPVAPPWTGWIRSLRIYETALPDGWIALSQRAELDPHFMRRLDEESVEAARRHATV